MRHHQLRAWHAGYRSLHVGGLAWPGSRLCRKCLTSSQKMSRLSPHRTTSFFSWEEFRPWRGLGRAPMPGRWRGREVVFSKCLGTGNRHQPFFGCCPRGVLFFKRGFPKWILFYLRGPCPAKDSKSKDMRFVSARRAPSKETWLAFLVGFWLAWLLAGFLAGFGWLLAGFGWLLAGFLTSFGWLRFGWLLAGFLAGFGCLLAGLAWLLAGFLAGLGWFWLAFWLVWLGFWLVAGSLAGLLGILQAYLGVIILQPHACTQRFESFAGRSHFLDGRVPQVE